MSDVQIAVIDQQDTQVVLAVPGVQGATGSSIPSGGVAEQVLRKNSSTNYDANWSQVTSAMIADGTIVNADVNASAAIAGTKIAPNFGSQTVQTTGIFSAAGGSQSAPSIAFTGDTNTGIYSPGADQVAISTNGTGRLFVDASGNVGVGTASPDANLEVVTTSSSETELIRLRTEGNTNNPMLRFFSSESNKLLTIGTSGSVSGHELSFRIGNNEASRIDSSGRLLVGTSSSVTNFIQGGLQVASTGDNSSISLTRYNSSSGAAPNFVIGRSKSGTLGTNTVVASGDKLGSLYFTGADGSTFVPAAVIESYVDGTPGANDMPGRLVFSTNAGAPNTSPTERMRIGADGTSAMVASNGTFAVLVVSGDQPAGTGTNLITGKYSGTLGSANSGTSCFVVRSNGNVENTNNSYTGISDIKLKENIVDASSQWDDIKALRPVNYNFKEGQTHTQLGLIAQEVELVSPGLVSESLDLDEDGNDLGTVTKSVNYSVLYMKAVKALQEAMERIETLEAKVAALEAS